MGESIHSHRHEVLRKMLREKREQLGLTQTALAVALGRPQSFVSKYETGERDLSVIDYIDVLRAMGADPAAFLKAYTAKT